MCLSVGDLGQSRPSSRDRDRHTRMIAAALILFEPCAFYTSVPSASIRRVPRAWSSLTESTSQSSDSFFVAARENDADTLKQLLEQDDIDLNAKSVAAQGSTALHLAASFGSLDALEVLVDAGANLESQVNGARPLHLAAFKNENSIVKRLLEAGADANAEQEDGSTALLEASAAGHALIVDSLLKANADPNRGTVALPLPSAALKNHTEVVELLLRGGADPNALETDGATALLKAAAAGNVRCVELLLEADANADVSLNGLSALHYAAIEGHLDVVKALIAAGADVTVEDEGGNTPLRYVLAASEPAKIAHALLQAGAAFEV